MELAVARSDLLDESTMRELWWGLPADRRRKSDSYYRKEDRHLSIVAFSLLQQLWTESTGRVLPRVALGAFGKPEFEGVAGWHFNLSHDASVCACVLATVPVGVDVQSRVPFNDALFERMAAPGEQGLRERLARIDDLSGLWSRKEAMMKRTGHGLTTVLQDVNTLASSEVLTFSDDDLDVRISISADGLDEQALHSVLRVRWLRPVSSTDKWVESGLSETWRRLTRELTDAL